MTKRRIEIRRGKNEFRFRFDGGLFLLLFCHGEMLIGECSKVSSNYRWQKKKKRKELSYLCFVTVRPRVLNQLANRFKFAIIHIECLLKLCGALIYSLQSSALDHSTPDAPFFFFIYFWFSLLALPIPYKAHVECNQN